MKHILNVIFFIIFAILVSNSAHAEFKTPAKVEFKNVEYQGGVAKVIMNLKIDDGWYAYAEDPGDTGVPFEVFFEENKVESSKIYWPKPSQHTEMIGPEKYKTNIYEGEINVPISFTVDKEIKDLNIDVDLSFGVCKNICLPVQTNHTIKMQDGFLNDSLKNNFFEMNAPVFNIWLIMLFAFLGGLVLNLMPCVLPVLSIKVMNVIKYAGLSKGEAKKHLLVTSVGIVVSFLFLACVTILLRNLGMQFGWGFHFQEPFFLIFLCVVLWVFALNLWGEFEIILPSSLADKIQFSSNSYQSSFYTGAFATLLATPCTAPFITTSVAFALSRTYVEIFSVYALMGLGMAFPYYAIAASKTMLKAIPKPGKWMNTLKKIFALMILSTLGWLIYVLSFQVTAKSVAMLMGGLLIVKFALTGWKKFNKKRFIFLAIAFVIAVVMPFLMDERDDKHKAYVDSAWQKFSEEKLESHINEGKLVFVDVTAEWCLVCKTNKFFVLDQKDFINHLMANNVIMLRADFTNKSPEIAAFLEKNGAYGIPFNALYSESNPRGIRMPELLSRDDVYNAIEEAK